MDYDVERDKGRKDILKAFLEEERVRGRREQGLSGLRRRVPKFFDYLDEEGQSLFHIGLKEAVRYQGWLLEYRKADGEPYSERTVISYLVGVTAFFEYLRRHELVLTNPFKSIRRIREEKSLPRNLMREQEADELLARLTDFGEAGHLKLKLRRYRVHLIAELLYSTGLRISEAAALRIEDIDFSSGLLYVVNGKGGRDRVCLLNGYVSELLVIYIDEIRPLLLHGWHEYKDTLFLSHRDRLSALMREEIPGTTSHSFRHMLGYHLLRSGCSLRSIQAILGHESLRNTEIYTKVDQDDLKSVLDHCHPRRWGKRTA